MKQLLILSALLIFFCSGLWNCKDTAPTAGGLTGTATHNVRVAGSVIDLSSLNPVYNAVVKLTTESSVESTTTSPNGTFLFEYDLQDLGEVAASLSIRKRGYIANTVNFVLHSDTLLELGLRADLSTSAIIKGVVRDSATLFPLRNAVMLFSVPGFADSVVTAIDGAFTFTIDLIDRDSLPVVVTLGKSGFRTKQFTIVVRKGRMVDLGNVLMSVDQASVFGQVTGRVYDGQTRQPILNATVVISSTLLTDSTLSTNDGGYSFSINLRGLSGLSGSLRVNKNGYRSKSFSFSVSAGSSAYNDVFLDRDTTTGVRRDSGTGTAHAIAFVSMTAREISVYGVGGTESSIIIWEVRDSLGFPIDIDHRDTVTFDLIGVPVQGGAYVSPSAAVTNVSGRVATTVNSGTVSGVLQFVARLRRDLDGRVIVSQPVIITVNAGLPDQAHFTIGIQQRNFAGYDWLGRTNEVAVLVGDKYSNPVKPGTAVYFNTTGGVVDASGFTNPLGFARNPDHGSIFLYSGNPLPRLAELASNPALFGDGTGYLRVRSYTRGDNPTAVTDSILVLMSGYSQIRFDTLFSEIHVDSGTCVSVPVTISDRFGNPLAPGTSIRTTIQFAPPEGTNWSVTASGMPEDPLADFLTRGPGSTSFTLKICDGTVGGTPQTMPFVVTIRVTGDNGNTQISLTGDVGP